ncbi:unnamed protein product [Adineta steineri]|uniref:Tetratricopeptide repeat protein n=1 Tax=Adineta steineri TaxID=433720 RepID=A0A819FD66_9BILA|nr:unnamed protein product [Adineta steineri]CAF3864204.1 unnamed protein product [Adineta steineri]
MKPNRKKYHQAEYPEALLSYEKALEIQQQLFPSNNANLSTFYSSIDVMYTDTCDYSKAFSYYEKALPIQQQSLLPYHSESGAVHIGQQSLPTNHSDLQKWRGSLENIKNKL